MTRNSLILEASFLLTLLGSGAALAGEAPLHIDQVSATRAAIEKVNPTYSGVARQLHLQGGVQLQVVIAENGTVEEVKPMTGNAVLMISAVAAMKQWKFSPFLSQGKPSRAIVEMSFNFHM